LSEKIMMLGVVSPQIENDRRRDETRQENCIHPVAVMSDTVLRPVVTVLRTDFNGGTLSHSR